MTHETIEIDQDLIVIQPESRLDVFTKPGGIEPLIKIVRDQVENFVGDVTTEEGRTEMKRLARRIGQSKTYLEKVGKDLADEQKKIPKLIDAARGKAWDALEALQKKVRQPVTDWEDAEKARIQKHADAIESINRQTVYSEADTAEALRLFLANVERVEVNAEVCGEFVDEYRRAKDAALEKLAVAIMRRDIYESEQAELAALRAAKAVQEAKDRDALIAAEAASKALAEQAAAFGRQQMEAKMAAEAIAEAAKQREIEFVQREADFARQAAEAERRAAETAANLIREQDAAKAREAAEVERREADRAHCGKVNAAAVKAFVAGGLSDDVAKLVVKLIVKSLIPAVSISY